jgi:hypothetical protein
MSAENDSDQFRVMGQADYPPDSLQPCGIRFGVKVDSPNGKIAARFKRLHVRAESVDGSGAEQRRQTMLESLDEERSKMPIVIDQDLAEESPSPADFNRWVDATPWVRGAEGLLITSPGTDQWTAAGLGLRRVYAGDFDTEIQFDVQEFARPRAGLRTQVYLQLELAGTTQSQVEAMFTLTERETHIGECLLRRKLPAGDVVFQPISKMPVKAIDTLRIARRGKRIFIMIGDDSLGGEQIIGSVDVGPPGVPVLQTRVQVRTGGSGLVSKVLLKSLRVRAQHQL